MINNRDREIVLKLNASYKVKHEKFADFPNSYFTDVYNQAAQIVKEIIDTGKDDFDSEGHNGYTEPISNVVTFNGKRGSGKTSAMLSFCDFLKNFEKYRDEEKISACRELLQQKVSFTVLDCIDATLITRSEDLIGAILGKMLVAIKEKEAKDLQSGNPQNIEIRKLKSRLGAIYSSLTLLDGRKEEAAPGEVLEQLSRSWNQQEAFREAVKKFNKYMTDYKERKVTNYLVVTIDDVDMNISNCYGLLEVVRKYLMAPNVIVLLAADYHQLGELCKKVYLDSLAKVNVQIEELALEYLEKLIPTGRRIYMPELYQEKMLYGKRIVIENERGNHLSIKEAILYQVWEHTGLLLDINAEVNHWLLPRSLRKLSNLINSMRSLSDYGNGIDKNEIFTGNICWFYDDLMSRYLKENDDDTIVSIIDNFNNNIFKSKIPELIHSLENETFVVELNNSVFAGTSYGTLLCQLYLIWKSHEEPTIVQVVSFAVSLYLRTYIFAIENGDFNQEEKYELKADFLKITKGEFWGEIDQYSVDKAGKAARLILSKEKTADELIVSEELSEYGLLILAIQLSLSETAEGKLTGSLQFGNFVNIMFDYENKVQNIAELLKTQECFLSRSRRIQKACDEFIEKCKEWENTYGTTRVIPFDSVEFMIDLYNKFYGAKGVFVNLSARTSAQEYGALYVQAINETERLLRGYDEYYKNAKEKYSKIMDSDLPVELRNSYGDIYANCPFIKYIKEMSRKESEALFSNSFSFLQKVVRISVGRDD